MDELELFREHLRERNFKESTVTKKYKLVRTLRKRSGNLWDSDMVTQVVNDASWGNRRKNNAFYAYRDWCRWKGFDYEVEKLREESSPLPYIPSEKEIDQLIAACNPYLGYNMPSHVIVSWYHSTRTIMFDTSFGLGLFIGSSERL